MKRYYFDLWDGDAIAPDEEGMELPSLAVAQAEATHGLADIAKDAARGLDMDRPKLQMAIEVRDDTGPLLEVKFVFEIDRLH